MIDQDVELEYSSNYEVEIRAMTVVAVDQILEEIRKDEKLADLVQYAYQVDWLLWQMGEARLGQMKPHHKVLSIYY